ncbi:MAG: Bifunctional protein GlmU [Firmicutes bacterium ADurb.Bin182]|nr:MAG: Bifunctional protein GlmU [Firmicutes bacterium ADurb.Bin182]
MKGKLLNMKLKSAIVLAYENSQKMKSALHKSLHRVCSLPLPVWAARAAEPLCEEPPVVIIPEDSGFPQEYAKCRTVFLRGGGCYNALSSARKAVSPGGYVFILRGDMPLIKTETLEALAVLAKGKAAAVLTRAAAEGSGSILNLQGASPAEGGIHCGVYCFDSEALFSHIEKIGGPGGGGLGKIIEALSREGRSVAALAVKDVFEVTTVDDRIKLSECEREMRRRINDRHMESGVTFIDPERAYIDPGVSIGKDTVIYPDVVLQGETAIGERVILYPGCRIISSTIKSGCILQAVVSNEAEIGENVTAGPFVNLRPGTRISNGCKIGDFVEIKNSNIGEGSKVPHLSYVGDGDMGANVNIGCGTVFSNYDGFKKHRTVIGDNAFIGCNTNLVAPVKVGNNAYTAAGSTITEDVPDGSMAFARARQVNKEGYAEKFKQKKQN